MTNIVKRGVDENLEAKISANLLRRIKRAITTKDFKEILNSLLTNEEKIMLYKRIAIADLLKEGRRYKEIGEILDVSSATISFVKKGLKKFHRKEKEIGKITKKDLREPKRKYPQYPTYKGKGRWAFLDRL
jgi:uncharacterized protein YerC